MKTTPSRTNPLEPYGLHITQAPAYWYNDILWTLLASAKQTGDSYSLMETVCPELSGLPPHTNEQDEMIYVLEGEAMFLVGDQTFVAKAGTFVFIPEGVVHCFRIESNTARLLNFSSPAGFEQVISEVGRAAPPRTLPPIGVSQHVDTEKEKALMERVGMHQVAVPDLPRN